MALQIDRKTSGDKVVVSTTPQTDATTAATLDRLLLFDESSFIRQVRDAETNETEKTGEVEATDVDVRGRTAEGQLNASKAQPDHFGWAFRYIMGAPTTTPNGTSGYDHVYKMSSYPTNPDYFSAGHRKGGASSGYSPADYAQHVGLSISQLELRAQKGEFLQLNTSVVGIGKINDGIVTQVVTGVDCTAATATFNIDDDPQGDDANRIFVVVDESDIGNFNVPVEVTLYTTGTNLVTIDTSAITGTHDVRCTYERVDTVDTWKSELTGATSNDEYKMKATNMRLYLNRDIDTSLATPTSTDGQYGECEIDDFSWTFNWNATALSCWATSDPPDVSGEGQQVETGDVIQRISVNRGVRDWLIKQSWDLEKPFSIEIWSKGPEIDATESNYFAVRVMFPFCKILDLTQEVNDTKHRDSVEIAVLKDPGTASGGFRNSQLSVAAIVTNKQSSYA